MAETTSDPWLQHAPAEAVAESLGATYVSAQNDRWSSWQPALPAEVAAFLAPPLIIASSPWK